MPRAKKQAISPEDYKRILGGLEILRIDVDDYSGKVLDRAGITATGKKRAVNLAEKVRFETVEGARVVIWHAYQISVSSGEEPASKLMTLSVEFRVEYASAETFTSDFFEQFRKISLQLQTAPFARAWIHDHCLRMGVSPLILPLVRTP